jgi:hypothetical protein
MKNVTSIFCFLLVFAACKPTPDTSKQDPAPIDKSAIEKEAGALMDRFYEAQKGDKPGALDFVIAEDVIAYGTDPDEIMDKASMLKTIEQYKQDPAMAELMATLKFEVIRRDIRISDDGSQVVLTDQVNISFSKLPVRSIAIMGKEANDWKINYYSGAFLIKNSDLAKVDSIFMVK